MQMIIALRSGRLCEEKWYCDGIINCDWLTPNDEANCPSCPSHLPSRCNCNVEGNFTCEWDGDGGDRHICYEDKGKQTHLSQIAAD